MDKDKAIKILNRHKKVVWPEIKKLLISPGFPKVFRIPRRFKNEEKRHWKIANEYPKRFGKYFRPTILLLTASAMGQKGSKALITAAAMQLSEEWILIHDDIEDKSLIRRGGKTLHRMYSYADAVNAGDALHVCMWKILLENHKVLDSKTFYAIFDEFYRMLMRTIIGQSTEINWTNTNKATFSDDEWYFIVDGKTSYYTVTGPMRLGAMIAGATSKELEKIDRFGIELGRCFQLVDDVLDLTSTFQGQKDQVGNDIYEGKRTVILGHTLRTASAKDKKKLLSILEKPRTKKSATEVRWILNLMKQNKSIEYATSLAGKHKKKAFRILDKDLSFLKSQPARSELETLAHFVLERKH